MFPVIGKPMSPKSWLYAAYKALLEDNWWTPRRERRGSRESQTRKNERGIVWLSSLLFSKPPLFLLGNTRTSLFL